MCNCFSHRVFKSHFSFGILRPSSCPQMVELSHVTQSTGSSAVSFLGTHVQSEHQLAHRHGCGLWSSVKLPIKRERAQQKRDFHCCKFCPDLLPNFLSSHPKCYKRRETLCLISSFFAHMKGMGSDCKLAAEQLSVETTTASVFGPPVLWWPLFLPPV